MNDILMVVTPSADRHPDCRLGRPLGNCPLQQHCGSLYDVLNYLFPPVSVLSELRNDSRPEVRDWLNRLDSIFTRQRRRQW